LTDRFLREAPQAWRELRERHRPVESILRVVSEQSQGNSRKYTEHFKHNGNCTVYLAETVSTDQTGETRIRSEVWGINDRYAFYLRRKSVTAPWAINYLTLSPQGDDATEIRRQIDRAIWFRQNELLFVDPENLPEMLAKPYFKLSGIRPISEAGQELVEIEFLYPHPPDERAPHLNCPLIVESGTIVLDPKRYWCIRSLKINGTYAGGTKYVASFRNTIRDSNPPSLSKKDRVDDSPAVDIKATSVTEIDKLAFSPAPPKSDFTLTAFGLPEPVGIVEPRTPLYLWVALVGIVLVICGVAIHRYALRTR
jgi:hypothetical protein